jgi:hypothetical protein
MGEYRRNCCPIMEISFAASMHVSAEDEEGSFTGEDFQWCGGYAIAWCRRITAVLCVMCARVRFESIIPSALRVEASRHLGGRKSFHLQFLLAWVE